MKRWTTRDKKLQTKEFYMDVLEAKVLFKRVSDFVTDFGTNNQPAYPDNYKRYLVKTEFGDEGKYV